MKGFLFALVAISTTLSAAIWEGSIGPHFNYTRIDFNNPSVIEGYMGGLTAGAGVSACGFFGKALFEGSWNAGPITGNPCQKSNLREYFIEFQVGGNINCSCNGIRPYVGFGWDRFENIQDPSSAHLLYRYDKLFVPVGVYAYWQWRNWETAIQFEWRPDVYSRLHLIGIDLDPRWEYAIRVQVPIKGRLYCRGIWSVEITPFVDWNKFGRVRQETSARAVDVIPRLERLNAGLRLLIGREF